MSKYFAQSKCWKTTFKNPTILLWTLFQINIYIVWDPLSFAALSHQQAMRFTNVKMSESVGRSIEKTLKWGSKSTSAKWVLATCIIVLNSKTSHIYMWEWNVVTFNYTESETKLLYCCMFRLRMSEHGPRTRSNLKKKMSVQIPVYELLQTFSWPGAVQLDTLEWSLCGHCGSSRSERWHWDTDEGRRCKTRDCSQTIQMLSSFLPAEHDNMNVSRSAWPQMIEM